MSRLLLIGLVVITIAGVSGTAALAQPDAGAKSRGDTRSFGDPSYGRSGGPSSYRQPTNPVTSMNRSYSYGPIEISSGDTVAVKGEDIKLMKGANVVGTVPAGLEFPVTKVINGWLGAVVEVEGQKLTGWIWHGNVSLQVKAANESPQATSEGSGAPGYRSFSFEPTQPSRSYGTYERKMEPWQYQKTDPRRYRH